MLRNYKEKNNPSWTKAIIKKVLGKKNIFANYLMENIGEDI